MKMVYKFPKLISETHYNNSSFIDDMALFVFIPNDSDIDQSINNFVKLRSEKRTYNDEVWLLDVSAWPTITNAIKAIEKSPLDLDDDLYLYKLNSEDDILSIDLWEHYEIHHEIPRKLLSYGHWTPNQGLDLVSEVKWMRRTNLEGINFRIVSVSTPGITTMEPINEGSDIYTMGECLIGEIWFNLQVVWI